MILLFPEDVAAGAARRWAEREAIRASNSGKTSAQIEDPARIEARMGRLANAAAATATINLAEAQMPRADYLQGIGLERVLGDSNFQTIAFLQLALAVSRFVGRINIRSNGRNVGYGTGFMVSPRLLMTNNHVLPTAEQARTSLVEFDYQLDPSGREMRMTPFALDPQAFFMTDQRLDFTLVAVAETSAGGGELRMYGWSPLIGSIGKILNGEHVNIIQHPRGNFKSFVSRDNKLVDLLDDHLHYVTDTEPGSSGSPVYNDQWEVVALHHSGVPAMIGTNYQDIDGGVWNGRDPDRIKWIANEGVRVSKLVDHISRQPLDGGQARLREQMLNAKPKNPIELAMEWERRGDEPGRTISTGSGRVDITVPLKISIELGQPLPAGQEAAPEAPPQQIASIIADAAPPNLPLPSPAPAAPMQASAANDEAALNAAMLKILSLGWQDRPVDNARHEATEDFGRYEGLPAKIALLPDGRRAELLAPLTYFQADGLAWPVPQGITIDGASIPRVFWSLIGGPFEGKYRDGSIVHDHYCVVQTRSWRDTHRMFHEAMRASGVDAFKAKVMFYAVHRFGPRWTLAGEAAPGVPAQPARRPVSGADAAVIVADAQAIFAHDLSLEEIANLAEARNRAHPEGANEAATTTDAAALERARLLVVTGGRGTAEDLEVVAAEAAALPGFVMDRFEAERIRILACRDSVTDFETSLRGKIPRGWEGLGRSWDDVPGAYLQDKRRVVIATVDAAAGGGRAVPGRSGGKHGSISLVVHEALHGYDYAGDHKVLRDPAFVKARQESLAALDAYQRQDGQAGLEETFAESGARFVVEPQALLSECPSLSRYWQAGLAVQEVFTVTEAIETPSARDRSPAQAPIGHYAREADGSVQLELRAEGDGGAIGHAWLTLDSGSEEYARLQPLLQPDPAARESAGGGEAGLIGVAEGGRDAATRSAPKARRRAKPE